MSYAPQGVKGIDDDDDDDDDDAVKIKWNGWGGQPVVVTLP